MELFPAIDMIDGKVVRLFQGDYAKQETYGEDPAAFARKFEAEGARYLHLVDLDGAKEGRPCNFTAVKNITSTTNLFCELGGGIRDEETVLKYFEAGVGRVILGTAALQNPEFTRRMAEQYKEKIAVGVDARNGCVAVEGWLETSNTDSVSFCKEMQTIGVKYIIYTDISKDGAQTGTNLEIYKELSKIEGVSFTASGGVSSLADIRALKELGLYAAIVGKALYTGTILLPEALAVANG